MGDGVTYKRPIWAYDSAGSCRYYDSMSEASRDLDVPVAAISRCCQGTYKSACGYTFEYYQSDQDIDNIGEFRKHSLKNYKRNRLIDTRAEDIVAVNIQTGEYRIFDNFSYMCEALGLDRRNAYRVLRHDRYYKSAGGWSLWKYSEVDFAELNRVKKGIKA